MSKKDAEAFARLSAMPVEYFDRHAAQFPGADLSALRLFIALRTAARRVDNAVTSWLGDSNLTVTKLDVLHLLSAADRAMTIKELQARLNMTQPNVTYVVAHLQRDGMVRRAASREDGRVSLVRLSPKGRAAIERCTPHHLELIAAAVASLPQAERERLVGALARVAEGFESVEEPARGEGHPA